MPHMNMLKSTKLITIPLQAHSNVPTSHLNRYGVVQAIKALNLLQGQTTMPS